MGGKGIREGEGGGEKKDHALHLLQITISSETMKTRERSRTFLLVDRKRKETRSDSVGRCSIPSWIVLTTSEVDVIVMPACMVS